MLGYSELDMKVSDTDMETMESDDYRGISRNNRNINDVLAAMWEEARFSHKDGQNFINPFT